jgi:hypothetical protein
MFSGIHDVDWASMHHAYGSAEDVPALLEAPRQPDAQVRERAREPPPVTAPPDGVPPFVAAAFEELDRVNLEVAAEAAALLTATRFSRSRYGKTWRPFSATVIRGSGRPRGGSRGTR